jgi:hypothetical protein
MTMLSHYSFVIAHIMPVIILFIIKNGIITCSMCNNLTLTMSNSYSVDYDGSPIIKTLDWLILDSNSNIYELRSLGQVCND